MEPEFFAKHNQQFEMIQASHRQTLFPRATNANRLIKWEPIPALQHLSVWDALAAKWPVQEVTSVLRDLANKEAG